MSDRNYTQGFSGCGKPSNRMNQMGRRHGQYVLQRLGPKAHAKLARELRGGAWWDVFDPNKNGVSAAFQDVGAKITNEFTNPNSVLAVGAKDFGNKALNEFTDPNSILRGQVLPIAADVGSVLSMAIPGAGPALSMGLKAVSLANKANEGAKMLGLGQRRRGRRGGAWGFKMPSFSQIQNAAKQAQDAYALAQQYSPMVKSALNTYGGEYGASAANALGQVGLGRRRGRRGGAWGFKMPSFSQISNAAKQAQDAYKLAQQYSPMVKDALNAYGGEYGASAANALGQVGLGRRRGRRGGAWGFKMPSFSQISNAAKQAQDAYKMAQQYSPMVKDALNAYGGEYGASAANALGQVGLGRRRSGNDGRSARAAIVRQVMMERGVNLPTASRIVKNEGLY